MTSSFGQRLKAARVMRGLSMDRLVEAMDTTISKQAISKYENDLMKPDSRVVIALCRALDVSPDYFFQETSVVLSRLNFRKKSTLGAKSIASLKETVRHTLERYIEVESLLKARAQYSNPLSGTAIASQEDLEDAAQRLRKSWGVGSSSPVAHVIALLEDHGVKVIEVSGYDHFDGLSGEADGHPFIVLKSEAPTDRKRLTALHEFAHLSLVFDEQFTDREQEKLCHGFAAAVILPRDVVIRELGGKRTELSFFELASIKKESGISMQAVVQRAFRTGVISEYLIRHMSIEFSRRGWKTAEPVSLDTTEHPFHFNQLVHRAVAEEVISVSRGAYLAGKTVDEFRREILLDGENPPS